MDKVTIGFAPTRRNLFSAEAAVEYANLTRQKMDELAIDYVDILDINEDSLLYDDEGVEKIAEKFKAAKIDGLFLANENFGTEYAQRADPPPPMVHVCGIRNAVFSLSGKSCAVSRYLSPMSKILILIHRNLPAACKTLSKSAMSSRPSNKHESCKLAHAPLIFGP